MNLNIIKSILNNKINKKVKVYEKNNRNKKLYYWGYIYKTYPRIFSVKNNNIIKTYSYNEVIDGEVVLIFD